MRNPAVWWFRWLARQLSRGGVIDSTRGERIAALTWPRFVTMLARFSLRVSDISMVGLSVGAGAITGVTFATVYWQVGFAFGIGIAGGTIGLVAQRYSADRTADANLVLSQSVVLGFCVGLPFVVVYWFGASSLIRVFTADGRIVNYGATYLRVSAIALLFVTFNVIASRALAGADNTWIPMCIRATGAVLNIGLNAVFIFGLHMGVFGAALGSVIAEGMVASCFAYGLVGGELPVVGSFPIGVSTSGSLVAPDVMRPIGQTAAPLVGKRLGMVGVRFPLLALLAMIGPAVVASFEVARRVRNLLNAFGAGFSMSASSLVGQALGRAEDTTAIGFAKDSFVFSGVVYGLAAGVVFVAAPLVARLFSTDPEHVARTIPFIRAASVSFVGLGMFRTFEGILKGAGDNRWTMYGRLVGLYGLLLPVTALGTITSFGPAAVFIALIGETWGAAVITGYRVVSGRWTDVGLARGPSPAD